MNYETTLEQAALMTADELFDLVDVDKSLSFFDGLTDRHIDSLRRNDDFLRAFLTGYGGGKLRVGCLAMMGLIEDDG